MKARIRVLRKIRPLTAAIAPHGEISLGFSVEEAEFLEAEPGEELALPACEHEPEAFSLPLTAAFDHLEIIGSAALEVCVRCGEIMGGRLKLSEEAGGTRALTDVPGRPTVEREAPPLRPGEKPMTKKKKPSVLARLERSRKRLEGRADELQAWFRGEIHERTGWSPGKSTVHRYVHGQASLDERAERVLEELEAEAEKVGPWEPPAALELPELGAELERNVLLLADFINGATYEELSEAFGISETRAGSIVQRAGVRRLADLA